MGKKKSRKFKKKPQKKQRKQQKEEKNELPEVSKELYELQISDLNSKLKRVKEQCAELEVENSQIRKNLTQENEDRADVIIYLKRVLKTKSQDIIELQEQVTTLQQAREHENSQFSEQLSQREVELKKLQERLTTEINLLNGKLNVLDEFRVQKEELTKKFELQEEAQKLQERQHQETLHNVEKDFILKKIRDNEAGQKLRIHGKKFYELIVSPDMYDCDDSDVESESEKKVTKTPSKVERIVSVYTLGRKNNSTEGGFSHSTSYIHYTMKKEVEERLTQLSEDFQTVIQSKIDSTTRVTAIENDSLKTEMRKLMSTCKDLVHENNNLKTRECRIKIKFAMLKEELDGSIRKYISANKKLREVMRENEFLKTEVRIDVNDYQVQIEKLSDSLDEYKANIRQQIEINRELNETVLFHQDREQRLGEKLQSSLAQIEHMENVIHRASAVIQEILSDELNDECRINQDRRARFTLCLLEILKTAGIDGTETSTGNSIQVPYFL